MASSATRKTWETAFLLSASMSSSYQQTFDQAKAILHDLGMENVSLGDEAERAAQRQENAFNLAAAAIAEAGLDELLGRIKDAYADVIQVTMEFEYTMSAVEAIAGASAENVALLEEKARTLGETTVYTANESAQAMTYMAQAGWDTVEMLEGMDGVISLAAASGTDLAETSSIVADTLAGFGMEASETGRLADVLAQTASHTNTNVSLLGQTFSNSAATAGALGFSIEDVSAMLGTMANAGIKGAKAGTQLRMILSGLSKDITLTGKAFGEVDFSLFDENGDTIGLMETARQLREYFSQMTKEEKIANARAIAGQRNFNGLLAIVNTTDKEFEELYADIQNANGAAKQMADTRLDNLKGDVTLLKSAWEGLKLSFGEELTPAGRGMVQTLTTVVQGFEGIIDLHPGVVTGVNSVAGAFGGAIATIATGAAAIKAWSGINLIWKMFGAGPAAPVVAGIGALVGIFAAVVVKAAAADQAVRDLYADDIKMAESIQAYAESYRENSKAWKDSIAAIETESGNTDYLIDRLNSLYSIQDKTLGQKQEILSIVELLNDAVPDLALAYNEEADSLNLTADAIRERARAEVEAELMAEKQEKLKEKLREESALNSEVEKAAELYNSKKADYERVYAEQMEAQSWMGTKKAAESMEYNRYVVAAKEAMDQAQTALLESVAAQKDNRWWIDELSRQLSGEDLESGMSTGGGGTPGQYAALTAKNEAEEYEKNKAELATRLYQRNTLSQNLSSAQRRYEEAGTWWNEYMNETAEARALYDRYEADTGRINSEMEREASIRAERFSTISGDIVQAASDIQAAQAAIDENEAAIAELSAAVASYEGAATPFPESEVTTITVENNINITGSVDDETLEELSDEIEQAVEEALRREREARARLSYNG